MITAITNPTTATQTQPAAKTAPAPKPAASSAASTSANVTDTIQISNTAKAMMQEVTETPAQTAKEAGAGDRQAQRLLAKETTQK